MKTITSRRSGASAHCRAGLLERGERSRLTSKSRKGQGKLSVAAGVQWAPERAPLPRDARGPRSGRCPRRQARERWNTRRCAASRTRARPGRATSWRAPPRAAARGADLASAVGYYGTGRAGRREPRPARRARRPLRRLEREDEKAADSAGGFAGAPASSDPRGALEKMLPRSGSASAAGRGGPRSVVPARSGRLYVAGSKTALDRRRQRHRPEGGPTGVSRRSPRAPRPDSAPVPLAIRPLRRMPSRDRGPNAVPRRTPS